MKQEEFEKIERFIKGEARNDDREYLESLLAEEETNLYLRNCLEKDWYSFVHQSISYETDLTPLLDRIHHIIRKNETERSMKPLRKILRVYMKAAAILLIPMMFAGGLIYSYLAGRQHIIEGERTSARIFAPMGSRVSFSLPDGTRGMLNSGSRLDYSVPFISDRKVKLEGEAWFEVSHDKEHPFEITTGSSVVEVLGTSFNISAYPAENYTEVVLNEGKVEYQSSISEEKVIILPSERLVCHGGQISKSMVDPGKYNAWTEGKLVFRGDPMAEVARRIERWYNVKIVIADKEIERYSFRATFHDDPLEDVLRFLSMTSPIRYKVTPRRLLPDGIYEKEEVVIYKRR